jgi:hypothetical protein
LIKRILGCAALLGCWLMAGSSLWAHHSLAGVYDMKAEKDISGTVDKLQFTNPHGSLSIDVKNEDGTSTTWVFTLGSATALAQRGVGKTGPNALHVGAFSRPLRIPTDTRLWSPAADPTISSKGAPR